MDNRGEGRLGLGLGRSRLQGMENGGVGVFGLRLGEEEGVAEIGLGERGLRGRRMAMISDVESRVNGRNISIILLFVFSFAFRTLLW